MERLYNIRMRSSENNNHISGAERIVKYKNIHTCVSSMIDRSFDHKRGKPDFVSLKIEKIEEEINIIPPISSIRNIKNNSVKTTLHTIKQVLKPLKLNELLINSMYETITTGTSISGAMLIDINSGKRLDNKENGIRVSRVDWQEATKEDLIKQHPHSNSERKLEAIALASKVQRSGVMAELCCSDDPHYTTGYIALNNTYIRIPNMKKENSLSGGRIFLIDSEKNHIYKTIQFLEKKPVLLGEKI